MWTAERRRQPTTGPILPRRAYSVQLMDWAEHHRPSWAQIRRPPSPAFCARGHRARAGSWGYSRDLRHQRHCLVASGFGALQFSSKSTNASKGLAVAERGSEGGDRPGPLDFSSFDRGTNRTFWSKYPACRGTLGRYPSPLAGRIGHLVGSDGKA